MNTSGNDTELLLHAVDAVHDATTLDEALVALVTAFRVRFELWHANISRCPAGGDTIEVLAAWSLADTMFEPGMEVSRSITPTIEGLVHTLEEGHVAMMTTSPRGDSLVDHLLREQGVASTVAVPVHIDDHAMLLLSLGSSRLTAFEEVGAPFFHGLAAGIRERLIGLTTANTD